MLPFDYHPNFLQRRVQKLVSRPALARLFSKFLHAVDGPILKMSGGLRSLTHLLAGVPVVLLTTTGARSGLERTTPLLGLPVDDRIILIASNWGQKHYPAWYYNLKAHPEVTATLNGQTRQYIAREAQGEEYQRYWQMGVRVYPGYESYVQQAGVRRIPVVVLEARDSPGGNEV